MFKSLIDEYNKFDMDINTKLIPGYIVSKDGFINHPMDFIKNLSLINSEYIRWYFNKKNPSISLNYIARTINNYDVISNYLDERTKSFEKIVKVLETIGYYKNESNSFIEFLKESVDPLQDVISNIKQCAQIIKGYVYEIMDDMKVIICAFEGHMLFSYDGYCILTLQSKLDIMNSLIDRAIPIIEDIKSFNITD